MNHAPLCSQSQSSPEQHDTTVHLYIFSIKNILLLTQRTHTRIYTYHLSGFAGIELRLSGNRLATLRAYAP